MNAIPTRRLVIVVRADPVICGHSVEGRNLAEVALQRGFDDVRIVTWPIERLQQAGLPLKPLDRVLPYSAGITVERPEPVGDYKVVDGRYQSGVVGRLVELFTDGVPTVCISLYLSPHTIAVDEAVRVARATGLPVTVQTIAEAVGSDITNVVRQCVAEGRMGAAAQVFAAYLGSDHCVAVSEYTRELIIESAEQLDALAGTRFAPQVRERVAISYPAIDTSAYLHLDPAQTDALLTRRGLTRDGYVFCLSRLASAKGIDDVIDGFAASAAATDHVLVIAGRGPQEQELRDYAAASSAADRIVFLTDVDDAEKPHLMAASASFILPTKPRPEFVETFGIALTESMLAGGGPVITTATGGVLEAVGETATIVPVEDPAAVAAALDRDLALTPAEREDHKTASRAFALQFDRGIVFDRMMEGLDETLRVRVSAQ